MASPFRELLNRIESRHDIPAKELSFERVGRAIRELDVALPERGAGVVLVAGTNGKGTISKTLEVLFAARGEAVGLFTSPHLIKTTERIRSHDQDLTEEEFVSAFNRVESLVEQEGLSHFEILTLMMIEVFFGGRLRPRVDRAVIEVGVGGRWDPTRHIPHEITVLSKLGLDHQNILGSTIEEIARHKFDAIDEGNLVIHAPLPPELEAVARPYRSMSRWVEAKAHSYSVSDEPRWYLEGKTPLKLMGRRAVENVSVALKLFEKLGLEPSRDAISELTWPGRMEEVEPRVYFSGDHNPQGIASLEEILQAFRFETLWMVVGIGKKKSDGTSPR